MEEIIGILVCRDHLTRKEAEEELREVLQMMKDCDYDPEECEEIFREEIGLEPDYMINLLLGE